VPSGCKRGASVLGDFLRPHRAAPGRAASHARGRMHLAPAREGLVAARYVALVVDPLNFNV